MGNTFFQDISITKRTLASFLLAGLIPLLILMIGGYVSVKNILTEEAIAHLSSVADQKERAFEEFSSANFLRSDITQPEFYDPSNEMAAFVSAPIFESGALQGIVAFQMRQAGIYDIVQNYSGLGSTGETVLGLKNASYILIASPLRNNPDAVFKKIIPLHKGKRQPMLLAHEGGYGSEIVTDDLGAKVLSVWRYLPSLRLGMVKQIVKAKTELLRSHSFLEVQVAERTQDLENALRATEEFNRLQKQFSSMASQKFKGARSALKVQMGKGQHSQCPFPFMNQSKQAAKL